MALSSYLNQGTKNLDAPIQKTGTGLSSYLNSNPTDSTVSFVGKKRDLSTVEGLTDLAAQKGFAQEAAKITKSGEDPNEIYSGGFIRDVFDTLGIASYAVAGAVKGALDPNKSFVEGIKEGVKHRASFTDPELLGKFGVAGAVGGTVLDIFTDPTNLIPVFGIGKKALSGIKQGTKFISKTKFAAPVTDALGRAFVYRFGQSPVYANMAEDSFKAIARGQEAAVELARPLAQLSKAEQRVAAQFLKGEIKEIPAHIQTLAEPIRNEFKTLGEQAVRLGLLDSDTYFKNINTYLPRLYRTHEIPEGVAKYFGDLKPQRADLARFKVKQDMFGVTFQPKNFEKSVTKKFVTRSERDEFVKTLSQESKILEKFEPIPDEVREAMGEILEAGYPSAKGIAQLRQAVEKTRFFNEVATKFSKDIAEDGLKQLPTVKTLGKLSGKFVPRPIFDDIQEIIRTKSAFEKMTSKAVSTFKFGKVIMNPSTHSRNVMSNFILNDFEGLSPLRQDIYAKAAKSILKKDALYQEAKAAGLGLDTFAAQEIKELLISDKGKIGKGVKYLTDKLSNIYQKEEEFAKMAQFIYQKSKGKTAAEAFKVAEAATFNYAQVTPFIRRLRQSAFGFPFITFTYKATPQVLKTLITKPATISKYDKIIRGVESLTPLEQRQKERAVEPEYIRNGFYVRLPGTDKLGRAGYLDLSYILPFGDLVSGQLFQGNTKDKNFIQTLLTKQPLLNVVGEIYANKDFLGQPIVKPDSIEPEQKGLDIFKYLAKFYGPPTLFDFPFRMKQSIEFDNASPEDQKTFDGQIRQIKTPAQEALRGLFGIKVQPYNDQIQATLRDKEKMAGLEEFLESKGVLRQFKKAYIPKDQ